MKSSLVVVITLLAASISGQAAALSLKSCAAIENPVDRLACYDTLAGRLPGDASKTVDSTPGMVGPDAQKVDVIEPAGPVMTQTDPEVPPAPEAEALFGLEHKLKPKEDRPYELKHKWVNTKKDAYGKWIITLENGQVWRQTDSTRFSFKNPEQWVVVSRGFLGSFFMGEPERNRLMRVERVK